MDSDTTEMNHEGETALITGGAHRVGKAITLALAAAGVNVVINYNTSDAPAEETMMKARSLGVDAMLAQADVSDYTQVQAMFAAATERFGAVDILINSASKFRKTPLPTDNLEDWHTAIDVLVHGSFHCSNIVAPMMLDQGTGVIINIVDLLAWHPRPGYAAHAVGKAALLALTRQLAVDLAPSVRVNAVAPGPVLPPAHYSPQVNARIAKRTLLQRWGTPEDVAQAVMYLINAEYVTAETITVDGGERYGSNL